ncbi:YicC/YloC family endoribonuclease [Halodurantibacterium flavum]|uniref:YicC/YloC family endoribonuclease n=1 Tax=Halodurantibacterium flavum TaxID=1382802 RepID=A0ABW4S373_9RHOB
MVNSMTGFASRRGEGAGASWLWELRGVNGKGLDLRLRIPEGIEGLEPAIRSAISGAVGRGSLQLSLRVTRDTGAEMPRVNPAALAATLAALRQIEMAAAQQGVTVTPARSSDILTLRGVQETRPPEEDGQPALRMALLSDLPLLLAAFNDMRAIEGQTLAEALSRHLATIADLVARARDAAEAQTAEAAGTLRANLARVMEGAPGADPQRVEQELALIAVKADISEELDRLEAHVAAARALLALADPIGRRLDFLMQEFNREANTLCSKSQSVTLTRLGLDLKAVIDQMREQVQNVE